MLVRSCMLNGGRNREEECKLVQRSRQQAEMKTPLAPTASPPLSMCANLQTTPTLASCADAIFASIQSSGQLSDEHLSSLNFLFEKHLSNALQIIDQGGVFCFVGEKSGRRAYQVQGQRSSDRYTVFPEHFCSCQSFHFDVLSKAEAVYCKHQLATRLAICLGKERTTAVADTVLAEILQE